jgi:hypothetical protein
MVGGSTSFISFFDTYFRSRAPTPGVWQFSRDEIADCIATQARKGDQLIVKARVRSHVWIDKGGEKHCSIAFIVTGVRFGAKRGPGPAASSMCEPRPSNPVEPSAEAVMATMTG